MKYCFFALCFASACSEPIEPSPPFIHVTVTAPSGFTPPLAKRFEVTAFAVLNGNPISDLIEVPTGKNDTLPTDFVITFSEQVRGQNVELTVLGFADGINVFSGTDSTTANAGEIEIIVDFCGDQEIDEGRTEECDDGALNSDTNVDACRTSCLFAFCGDGVLDSGEICDEGGGNSDALANACRTNCEPASCGDGTIDSGEECDEGTSNSDIAPDTCRILCIEPTCGDGVVDTGEQCDDSNNVDDDGCDADCVTTTVTQVSSSFGSTCAVLRSGALRCWGLNFLGQLGYGNTNDVGDDETPASVGNVPVGGKVVQVSTGVNVTCALLDTGRARCWGEGTSGQLGYGVAENVGDDETPASKGDITVTGTIIQIETSGRHTCVLLNTGKVRCWGSGLDGRLGYGNTLAVFDASVVPDISLGESTQISLGDTHTCAIRSDDRLICWGNGNSGQMGLGNTNDIGDDELPSTSLGPVSGVEVLRVDGGGAHTCIVDSGADVRCWGSSTFGQLGYGNTNTIGDNEAVPSSIVQIGNAIVNVSAGEQHTCALLIDGNVRCWGDNNFGQLGYTNTNDIGDNELPSTAGDVAVGESAIQISAGAQHTCALLTTGKVRCWGNGNFGRLGYGNEISIGDTETPASAGDVPVF